jgi:hypothetical protein
MRLRNGIIGVAALALSSSLTGCLSTEQSPAGETGGETAGVRGDTVWTTMEKMKEMGLEYKTFQVMGEERTDWVRQVGDHWVWQDDIAVEGVSSQASGLGKTSGNWSIGSVLWTNGIIPYKADASLNAVVNLAAAEWNRRSGVKWIPMSQLNPVPGTYVYFKAEAAGNIGGMAYVGMQSGVNVVSIYGGTSQATIMHEMGHEMGLLHEHQRTDRDTYVSFATGTSNANSDLCYPGFTHITRAWDRTNGSIREAPGMNYYLNSYCPTEGEPLGPYDQNSIMHYARRFKNTTYCLSNSTSGCHSVVDGNLQEVSGKPSIAGAGISISFWDAYWISVKYGTKGNADVVGIRRWGSSTANTWAHRLNAGGQGLDPFSTFNHQGATILGNTHKSRVEYLMADYNGDGIDDMWAIAREGSGSGKTNVTIMNGANNYKTILLNNTATILPESNSGWWGFTAGDFNNDKRADLYAINRQGAKTDLHIMNAASNFSSYLLQVPTVLGRTDLTWEFHAGDYDVDGKSDLYALYKNAPAGTEVHVMGAANNFASYICSRVTAFPNTTVDWSFKVRDWDMNGQSEILGIKRMAAAGTEIHIVSGSSNYTTFMYQRVTALPQTNATDWEVE